MVFKQYRRIAIAEMRAVTEEEIKEKLLDSIISVSLADRKAGSPRIGDMVARNLENHKDQWLVAKNYFKSNFKEI